MRSLKNINVIIIFLFIIVLSCSRTVYPAVITFITNQNLLSYGYGLINGSIECGDIDNDGDLDLGATGDMNGNYQLIVWKNNRGKFETTPAYYPMGINNGVRDSCAIFGDYDNDGDLDLAVSGMQSATKILILFKNNNGVFQPDQYPLGSANGLDYSYLAFADIDNDGDLDLAASGMDIPGNHRFIIFKNNNGKFVLNQEPLGVNQGLAYSSLAFGDFDKDDDLDMVITGMDFYGSRYLMIYDNNNGFFTFGQNLLIEDGIYEGQAAIADYDNDGDLDIAECGMNGSGRTSLIYKNNNGTFIDLGISLYYTYGQSSTAWIDADNNGIPNLSMSGEWDGPTFQVYNDGFSTYNTISPAFSSGAMAWGDFNNDKKADVAVVGNGPLSYILKNTTVCPENNPPQVPQGLEAVKNNGFWLLKWQPSGDDHTPPAEMRYQIAVGTEPGKYSYTSPCIIYPGGQANIGNVIHNYPDPRYQTRIPISTPICWKVLAIDTSFITSPFSPEQKQDMPQSVSKYISVSKNSMKIGDTMIISLDNLQDFKNQDISIEMSIFDLKGTLIKNLFKDSLLPEKGFTLTWDGTDKNHNYTGAGVYILQLRINDVMDRTKVFFIP